MNKKFPVKLNIYNDISNILPEFVFTKEEEPFYSTDTIYDLKKRDNNLNFRKKILLLRIILNNDKDSFKIIKITRIELFSIKCC